MEKRDTGAVMTCRYCILHEMGHCRKINPMTNEPKFLRMQNGTILRLKFDCQQCQMLVYVEKQRI
ncbi:MAG: hypothetical protein IIW05_01310 [Paludibacteraceae bacterium]|nr:hypothetical protein [Paludibacteraceae bacterium]